MSEEKLEPRSIIFAAILIVIGAAVGLAATLAGLMSMIGLAAPNQSQIEQVVGWSFIGLIFAIAGFAGFGAMEAVNGLFEKDVLLIRKAKRMVGWSTMILGLLVAMIFLLS